MSVASADLDYLDGVHPPMGPVLIVADSELQEQPIAVDLKVKAPKLALSSPPQARATRRSPPSPTASPHRPSTSRSG